MISIDAKKLRTIMNFLSPGNNIYNRLFLRNIIRPVLQVKLFSNASEVINFLTYISIYQRQILPFFVMKTLQEKFNIPL